MVEEETNEMTLKRGRRSEGQNDTDTLNTKLLQNICLRVNYNNLNKQDKYQLPKRDKIQFGF